ncbi:MAG TPA: hypothetical protein VN577_19395 [Terriglobales bacterium]|nr:hypothetical protein [Terriglobales bacterium]
MLLRLNPSLRILFVTLGMLSGAMAQETKKEQPEVRVNYLNVCTPSAEDQAEIRSALAKVPAPKFTPDFEISRGHSTMEQAPAANWVRIRKEFPASVPVVAAQYSMSVDEKNVIETLVFRSREAKDVIQVQLETTVSGAQDAKSVLATNTPVQRIKLERFGKSSVVLARCPAADQTAYEPLFRSASEVLGRYRTALGVKTLVPRELSMLGPASPAAKSTAAPKKK